MCDVIARVMFHAPLRHLAAAGLVGVLLTGLLPAPLNAARGGTSQVEEKRRCCRFKRRPLRL